MLRDAAQQRSWLQLKQQITTQHDSYRAPAVAWRFYRQLPLLDDLSNVIGSDKGREPAYPYPDSTRAWFTTMKNLTQHEMVITAIALKRYVLRHGQPPSNLAALVPEFLGEVPTDLMDGQPLRYRLNADGTVTLYSVGENLKDDGGDFTPDSITSIIPSWQESSAWKGRDWVWPQNGADSKHPQVSKLALQSRRP